MPSPVEIRNAYWQVFQSINPEFAITLTANQWYRSPSAIRNDIRRFHGTLDRLILKRNWHRLPSEQRSDAIWIAEHVDSNGHCHGALRLPMGCEGTLSADEMFGFVHDIFTRVVPTGSVDVKSIYDARGWWNYMAKDLRQTTDGIWLAREFHAG